MSFLQPLFLAGLLAAAIPIAIHLINRRKATRQEFPALRLLMESNKKEARSVKVRQWLLLGLRVLVIAALALALAKPYFLSDEGVTASERLPTAVVFVVDDSASMQHAGWWENTVEQFDEQLGKLRPWDEATLITASTIDGPVTRFTSDHGEIREAFSDLQATDASADLSQAVVAAGDLLSSSQLPSKRIVVISDFARGGFPDSPTPEAKIPYDVRQVSVRDDAESVPENLGITAVDYEQEHSGQGGSWKITATVRNFGPEDQKGVELRLNVDGEDIGGGLVDVPARKTSTHTFRHRFEGAGVREAYVELVNDDPLEIDNRYYFAVDLKERIRVLLVNGEPSSVAYSDELYFAVRALNPGTTSQSAIIPEMTTPEGLAGRDLNDFDVVVLANVATVSQPNAGKLEQFVDGGGGLLVTMGDQIDATSWNQTMEGLLPKPLRGLKRLAERDDPDAPVKITRLGTGNRDHPIFRIFDLPGGSSLQSVKVYSYMLLEPTQQTETREILAYKDNAPALIERKVGDGRVVMLTTTVDREWTDLPVRTAFLPLMRRSVQYLARRATSAGKDRPVVGERLTLDVSGLVDERAIIHGPEDSRLVLEPTDGTVGFAPEHVGFYEVWADSDEAQGDADNPRNRLDALSFAANVDSDESKLDPLGQNALDPWTKPDEGKGGEAAQAAIPTNERRVNVWPPILFAITMMLLLETLLGARRSVLAKVWRRITFQKDPKVEV
ncbi:VWA domain-containing protein [Persicimonas caeni]|uniref:VWA domain-containing protein n=1 Tax=Persicimonas caeni TaxID=2292766 RepID=A0A4Y6PRJ6_PERCE|nr:BatA domain-containing protein [Persicimonas caeni]QDG50860.1 VWA domain-containing protein [Persicimonas caeni]QED32081.1 VWA domain-containing protein [Persicimonas caeni]